MDNFEFFLQLDDLKGDAAESAKAELEQHRTQKAEQVEHEATGDVAEYEGGDFSFLEDGVTFEDEDGWVDPTATEETEPTEEVEEETEEAEEAEEESAETVEDEVDEDGEPVEVEAYDVDFDTVITLPDGRDMTIEELSTGYLSGTDLTERETKFQETISEFETRVAGMKEVLQLSELEADRVIRDYQNFDWDALAVEDPQAYVENKRFLERYQARKQELINAQQKLQSEAKEREEEDFRAKSVECVQILKQSIPNWSDALYETLLQFAIDNGASEDNILRENRPEIFKVLYKAYQFDTGRAKVMAKIKRPGTPKKVVKPGVKPVGDADKRELAAQRYAKGQMSQSEAFKFLED